MSALLKTTFESMNQGINVYDADFKLVAFNQHFIEFNNYPPDLIHLGMAYEDMVRIRAESGAYGPVDDIDALVRERVAARREGEVVRHERTMPDGRVVAISRDPMPGGGYVQTFTDITERRRAEEALQNSHEALESKVEERTRELRDINRMLRTETAERREISTALEEAQERFRRLVESTNAIPWEADVKTWSFLYVGPQAVELLGYPRELWLEKNFWVEHIHPEDRDWVIDFCQASAHQSENYEMEYRMIAADGRVIWLQDIVNVMKQEGEPVILRGFMLDITERKSLEELRRNISGWLISAQEEERRRISRELHDDFGQRLALLAVEIQSLSQEISEPESGTAKSMDKLWSQTQELSTDLHRLSRQLHPAILDQLGLGTAIRSLCSEITKQHGILIKYTEYEVPASVSPDIALCLYRTVQEGLRNIVKHSGAKNAKIELTGASDAIHLRIADQGVGFDPKTANGKGLGLVSIEERIRLVQGEMSLQSRPAHGTCIDLRIPSAAVGA
jgi:PAS domain S-box-containing protein